VKIQHATNMAGFSILDWQKNHCFRKESIASFKG